MAADRPHRLRDARLAEVAAARAWALHQADTIRTDGLLAAGGALYAAEGAKRDGAVIFANTDPRMVAFFCAWLRRYFDVDESRLRCACTCTPTWTSTRRWLPGAR